MIEMILIVINTRKYFRFLNPKNKVKIHAKRKHRLKRKELAKQIAEIISKYRTRLNNLYLDAEPKLQENELPLEALNK